MSKPPVTSGTLFVVALVAIAALALVAQWRGRPQEPLPAPLPTVLVGGWLNTDQPPTTKDLNGKWVVVDCWATWCGPCIASMPELAEFRRQWPEDEVAMIGLADDDATAMEDLEGVIESVPGFTWPVAYGGSHALTQMAVRAFPTLILYGPDGKEVTRVAGMGAIEEIEALIVAGSQ